MATTKAATAAAAQEDEKIDVAKCEQELTEKKIHLAIFLADKNSVEAPKAVSMRDGHCGMVVGHVSSYSDLEKIKNLHIDRGLAREVYIMDQNTANLITNAKGFEQTLTANPESAVILFAFKAGSVATLLASERPGQDCCIAQVELKEYPVVVEESLRRKKKLVEKLSLMRKTCLLRIIQIKVILDAFNSQEGTLVAFDQVIKDLNAMQENLDND